MTRYFIAGIGTDVGKTVVAALLTQALGADYWKPIQCGTEGGTDRESVKDLVTNSTSYIHPETYLLHTPVSPHHAADLEGICLDFHKISPPETERILVIEGAGGIFVPLNSTTLFVDLLKEWECEIICVTRHYIGSINHTLLTLKALKNYSLPVKGLIFNGTDTQNSQKLIEGYTGVPILATLPELPKINRDTIAQQAHTWLEESLFLQEPILQTS